MNEPLISIIVPIYNSEKFLVKCLDSIVGQTYPNLEILLIDDGSTDGSGKICDSYSEKDQRVKVIHKPNGGRSDARNTGIINAGGEYIAFVDSDDWIENDMLSYLYNGITEHQSDIACCGYFVDNGWKSYKDHIQKKLILDKKSAFKQILDNNALKSCLWNKLYKKETIKEIRFPIGENYEDLIFYKIMLNAEKTVILPEPKYHYFYNNNGIAKKSHLKDFLTALKILEIRYEETLPAFPDCEKEFYKSFNYYLQWWFNKSYRDTDETIRNECKKQIDDYVIKFISDNYEKLFLPYSNIIEKNFYKKIKDEKSIPDGLLSQMCVLNVFIKTGIGFVLMKI